MLMKPIPVRLPPYSFDRAAGFDVRLSRGIGCPHCRHELQASDVVIDAKDGTRLTCSACHKDLLTVEAPQ